MLRIDDMQFLAKLMIYKAYALICLQKCGVIFLKGVIDERHEEAKTYEHKTYEYSTEDGRPKTS